MAYQNKFIDLAGKYSRENLKKQFQIFDKID